MMHANTIEHPRPRREAAQSHTRYVKPLSSADRDYFRWRAIQEAEAARLASCCEARLAHEEMAEAYRLLCGLRKSQEGSHPTSGVAQFPF